MLRPTLPGGDWWWREDESWSPAVTWLRCPHLTLHNIENNRDGTFQPFRQKNGVEKSVQGLLNNNGYAFLDDLQFERLPFKHIVHSMWLITCNNVSFISEQQTCLVRPLVVPCSLCKYLRQTGPTNKHLVNSSRFQ